MTATLELAAEIAGLLNQVARDAGAAVDRDDVVALVPRTRLDFDELRSVTRLCGVDVVPDDLVLAPVLVRRRARSPAVSLAWRRSGKTALLGDLVDARRRASVVDAEVARLLGLGAALADLVYENSAEEVLGGGLRAVRLRHALGAVLVEFEPPDFAPRRVADPPPPALRSGRGPHPRVPEVAAAGWVEPNCERPGWLLAHVEDGAGLLWTQLDDEGRPDGAPVQLRASRADAPDDAREVLVGCDFGRGASSVVTLVSRVRADEIPASEPRGNRTRGPVGA